MATTVQPPLFSEPTGDKANVAPLDPRKQALFEKQVAAGISVEDARLIADRTVFPTKGAGPVKAAARKRVVVSTKLATLPQEDLPQLSSCTDPQEAKIPGPSSPRGLLPVHHPNRDFFLCDLFDYALKDDGVSMEAPIFTLATRPDVSVWYWESKDKTRSITVTPSVLGRATQFDKDLLIYVVSQMTEALNRGRLDANSRTVRFRVYDYLVSTNKPTGGKEYQRLQDALERLRGTSIKTNIKTGGQRVKEGFGIVDSWMIIEKSPDDDRMIAVEVGLSRWLFNAVQAHEVLTINSDYFRLRKPIERRLYELARKHCGDQVHFAIGVGLLQEKCGSKSALFEFRRALRGIIRADTLPDYRLEFDDSKDQVVFHRRGSARLSEAARPAAARGALTL